MGATFARSRTFIAGETLTAVNLNAIETNILNNFTPAGMDDQSTDVTAMRVTIDPYPSDVASLATSLQGEIERIRYIIALITGETYWYIDPDASLATIAANYLSYATIQSGSVHYIADTGTADIYVATLSPAVLVYTTGMEVRVKIANANATTTPTLNVNSLGAKTIKRGNSAALIAGDLPANHQAIFRYNGTDMILLNPALHTHADAGQGGNTLSVPTIADFTNANHTHASVAQGGSVTNPWPSQTAGDYLLYENLEMRSLTSTTSYVKIKETKVGVGGTFRIKFDGCSTSVSTIEAVIYRNGVAVGTTQVLAGGVTTGGTGYTYTYDPATLKNYVSKDGTNFVYGNYVTYSEDIGGWSAGDLVQVYVRRPSGGGPIIYVKSLNIYTAAPPIVGALLGY